MTDLQVALKRQEMIRAGQPQRDLERAEGLGQPTWTTAELQEEFEVMGFQAPFVVARRKSDGKVGSLEFVHNPRVYFGWREHDDG